MSVLLKNLYNRLWPNVQPLQYIMHPVSSLSHPLFHDISQPFYVWTHTYSVGDIRDVHTLRCLISRISTQIDFYSSRNSSDLSESLMNLRFLRDLCEKRILELERPLSRLPMAYFMPEEPVAESSAQGAARTLRESTRESWSRANWEDRFRAQQAANARFIAQQAAYEAAEVARARNAEMGYDSSDSSIYEGKGKGKGK